MHVYEAENDTTSGKATRGMIFISPEPRALANTIIGTRLRRSWCDIQRQAVKENQIIGIELGQIRVDWALQDATGGNRDLLRFREFACIAAGKGLG